MKRRLVILLVLLMALASVRAGAETGRLQDLYAEGIRQGAEGEYARAAETFDSISTYEDAALMALYYRAMDMAENRGKYSEAARTLEKLERMEGWEKASLLKVYYEARQAEKEADSFAGHSLSSIDGALDRIRKAEKDYWELLSFRDSEERYKRCLDMEAALRKERQVRVEVLYQEARALQKSAAWKEAADRYAAIPEYRDSAYRQYYCQCAVAEALEAEGHNTEAQELIRGIPKWIVHDYSYWRAWTLAREGRWAEAEAIYEELGDYLSSGNRAVECRYQIALELEKAGKYAEAAEAFQNLEDYKDSQTQIPECRYQIALELEKAGKYEEAAKGFTELEDYRDSQTQILECRYQIALALEKDRKYEAAAKGFTELEDYRDSREQVGLCLYGKASALERGQEYDLALEIYRTIPDVLDAGEHILECQYQIGMAQEAEGQDRDAAGVYLKMQSYKDCRERAQLCKSRIYDKARTDAQAGRMCDAYDAFLWLGSYSDAEHWAEQIHDSAVYEEGWKAIHEGDYGRAEESFARIPAYRDSEALAYACRAGTRAEMERMTDTTARIRMHGYTGFVHFASGTSIVSPQYLSVEPLNADCLAVQGLDGRYGVVDTRNQERIPKVYAELRLLREDALLCRTGEVYDLIGLDGQVWVRGCQSAENFGGTLVRVWKDAQCSVYLRDKEVIPPAENVEWFDDGLITARRKDRLSVYQLDGTQVLEECIFVTRHASGLLLARTEEGAALYTDSGVRRSQFYSGISMQGDEGVYAVQGSGNGQSCYGLIDQRGRTLASPAYPVLGSQNGNTLNAPQFHEGLIRARNTEGNWTFLNRDGKETLRPYGYEQVTEFENGLAEVLLNGKWDVIDRDGNMQYFVNTDFLHALDVMKQKRFEEAAALFEAIEDLNCRERALEMARSCRYQQADALERAGNPEGAQSIFENLGEYRDARERVKGIHYRRANRLEKTGNIEEALAEFEAARDYMNAPVRILKIHYHTGVRLDSENRWEEAAEAFHKAAGYLDASERCLKMHYARAESLLEQGSYEAAIEEYQNAEGIYSDCGRKIKEAYYHMAGEAAEAGNYSYAFEIYTSLETYRNAPEKARETWYALAEQDLARGEYVLAAQEFETLGEYRDAQSRVMEAQYRQAEAALAAGNGDEAMEIFERLGEYLDAKERIQNYYSGQFEKNLSEGQWKSALEAAEHLDQAALDALEQKIHYAKGKSLLEQEAFDKARAEFTLAGDYRQEGDEEDPVSACLYQQADALLEQKQYIEAQLLFNAIAGYKDAREKAEAIPAMEGYSESVQQGKVIRFGRYEQDGIPASRPEDIEWIVINNQKDALLLLSRKALDVHAFSSNGQNVDWKNSSVRKWLNEAFYTQAFLDSEKERILLTNTGEGTGNQGSEAVSDKVFLLSSAEINSDRFMDEQKGFDPTAYAELQSNKKENMKKVWCTRSVKNRGIIAYNRKGDTETVTPSDSFFVRPAVWIWIGTGESRASEEEQVQTSPQNLPEQYIRIKGNGKANIRAKADTDSKVVGAASPNRKYKLISVTDNGWFEIQADDGVIGFVHPNMAEIAE